MNPGVTTCPLASISSVPALVHPTHGRDGVAVNGDVGFDRFVAGTVDYGAIPDY